MNKTILVFKNELISTITSRSFIVTLLLVPGVSAIMMVVISILGQNTSQVVSQVVFSSAPKTITEGYVDQSGLIKTLPDGINASRLIAYPVSYTHLRAHETRHDLVCRLLLEK